MRLSLAIIVGLTLCLLSQTSYAECAAYDGKKMDSDKRVRDFFKSCRRKASASEKRLYTWGHKQKLALLRNHSYANFSRYNVAQQDAYAGAQARKGILNITQDKVVFDKFIRALRSTYGTLNVAELWTVYRSDNDLADIQNLWNQAIATEPETAVQYKLPRDADLNVIRSKMLDQTQQAQTGVTALAYEQVIPGFIESLSSSVDAQIKALEDDIKQAEKDGTPLGPLSSKRGKLLGLQRSKNQSKPSNISFGPAVYFSKSPMKSIGHFKGESHAGLMCSLRKRDRIVDISSPAARKSLLDGGVYFTDSQGNLANYPGGYNEVANPRHIRYAAMGLLMRNGEVYADNGVINYGACETLGLQHIKSCESILSVLGQTQFLSTDNGDLYNYFANQAGDLEQQLFQVFIDRIQACAVKQAKLPTPPTANNDLCKRLVDKDFKSSNYFKENERRLTDVWLAACNTKK